MRRAVAVLVGVVLGAGGLGLGIPARAHVSALDGHPICGAAGTAPAPSTTPAELRVGSYNILHTLTDDAFESLDLRLELQADALAAANVDVVGLQEVVGETVDNGNAAIRLARELAERTGQRWEWCWFQSNPKFPAEPDLGEGGSGPISDVMAQFGRNAEGEFRAGIAILSRFPIGERAARRQPPRSYEAAACTNVPPDPFGCTFAGAFDSRAVLWTRIGDIDLFTTHLAHGITPLSDTTKLLHTHHVLLFADEKAQKDDDAPDFLVGDFNSVEGDPRHAAVTGAGYVDTFRAANPTDPGITSHQDIRSPEPANEARIDFVFARPGNCAVGVTGSEVIGDASVPYQDGVLWPSDHYGVVSTVRATCP
jgi:endonuclease/exonuclease/phosphatase family metal-dependent hydrolase